MSAGQFSDAIRAAGLNPPSVIEPGKIYRFPGLDKQNGNRAAWCRLFDDMQGGVFGDWSSEISGSWQAKRDEPLSREEQAAFRRMCAETRKAQQAEQAKVHNTAAMEAEKILAAATGDPGGHHYIKSRQISPTQRIERGMWPQRGWNDALLIPLFDSAGKLCTLEAINTDGKKDFLKGGKKAGSFYPFGKIRQAETILIGEGFATVATVHEVTGIPAVAAMDAGNLLSVAEAARRLAPKAEIIICADNDIRTDGKNPGVEAATNAAKAVRGVVAVPEMDGRKCDFWDVWHEQGQGAVQDAVNRAREQLQIAPRPIDLLDSDGKKKSQATILIEIASQWDLFHDPNSNAYAVVPRHGHREIWPIRSATFKRILSEEFFSIAGKGCNNNAIADALNTVEAKAMHKGRKATVHLRVARISDTIYMDLVDEGWRVIKITSEGWEVINRSPVNFIRKNGMAALPVPSENGDIEKIAQFINADESGLRLITGWILGALSGAGPYPILVLQGEQGTGKSTMSKVIRSFVDPSTVPLRPPPREVHDLLVSAVNNHAVVLDNLSGLNPVISDCLCRFATGGGLDARKLFTDTEQTLVEIQRPIIVNGIDDIATRPDLAERSIILNLPVINDQSRKQESIFWREFDNAKSCIMGGIVNALSGALGNVGHTKLQEKPRMADFAIWITAAEGAMGWDHGSFLRDFNKMRKDSIIDGIEASPVGSTLLSAMNHRNEWTATPGQLLDGLTERAGNKARSGAWPKTEKGLWNILKRLAPNLRCVGIQVEKTRNAAGMRYKITKVGKKPTQATQPTQNGANPNNGAASGSVGYETLTYTDPTQPTQNSTQPTLNPTLDNARQNNGLVDFSGNDVGCVASNPTFCNSTSGENDDFDDEVML